FRQSYPFVYYMTTLPGISSTLKDFGQGVDALTLAARQHQLSVTREQGERKQEMLMRNGERKESQS
ncbi:MAG: hypothetical protein ACRC28_05270, partial [Clostridium sp.]|uniref:hypothetical protein n=1 Tax=Clostridium sp. TaxID=1506 RepID=UPI003F39C0FF